MPHFLEALKAFIAGITRRLFRYDPRQQDDRADLEQSAVAVALELERDRGRDLDLSRADDQEELVTRLRREWGAWLRGRRGFSLDEERPGDEGDKAPLVASMPAPDASNPLLALMQLEEPNAVKQRVRLWRAESYSEFVGYLVALEHVDFEKDELAAHLALSPGAALRRIRKAHQLMMVQPSPFDRVDSVPADLWPPAGRAFPRKLGNEPKSAQVALPF